MSALYSYNLIKEGDFYNSKEVSSTFARVLLSPLQLTYLYNGDVVVPSTTITGSTLSGTFFSVDCKFGETYSIHTVRYYQNLTTTSGVSITYGLNSPTEFEAPLTLASGVIETSVIGDARYIRVNHSCSLGVEIQPYEIHLIGVKNDLIGFGLTGSEIQQSNAGLGPVGYLSATPKTVSVFNDYSSAIDINLAVKPTGAPHDDYLLLGTSSSGGFYGLNDYGVAAAQYDPITTTSDSLVYSSFDQISSQWEVLEGQAQSRVYPDSEGMHIEISSQILFGSYTDNGGNRFWGLVSSDTFSGNQSFTISVEARVKSMYASFVNNSDVVLGFSTGMPYLAHSYANQYPFVDEHTNATPTRTAVSVGWSVNAVEGWAEARWGWGVGVTTSNYSLSYKDGDLLQTPCITTGPFAPRWDVAGSISLADFSNALYSASSDNLDGSSEAVFRKLVLSWNHVDRVVEAYIDNVFIGQRRLVFPPSSGARFFMGTFFEGLPNCDVTFRNFTVVQDQVYKQRTLNSKYGIASVSASSSLDVAYPPSNTVSGSYTYTDLSLEREVATTADQSWVSRVSPSTLDFLDFVFDGPRDIVAFNIHHPKILIGTTISGVSGIYYFGKILKTAAVSFTSSGTVFYSLSETLGYNNVFIPRDGTSGAPTTMSGVSTARLSMIDFHQINPNPSKDSVVIDEVRFIEEYYMQMPSLSTSSGTFPWDRGLFNNMYPAGGSGSWTVARSDVREIARVLDSSGLYEGVDFGVSSSFSLHNGGLSSPTAPLVHTLFMSRRDGEPVTSNTIGSWHWSSHPAWVWRKFDQKSRVAAIGFYWGSSQGIQVEQGYPDKFKVQYLSAGFDPTDEAGWTNVPTITTSYSGSGDYWTYREWFINNNDGEYYTGTAFAFPGDPGMPAAYFSVPSDIAARQDFRWDSNWRIYPAGSITNRIYLEFDEPIETQAIRLVIDESLDTARTTSVTQMNLLRMDIFADRAYGSYLSPVVDTGTENNTERVHAALRTFTSSSGVVSVRSSATPPVYAMSLKTLVWQPWHIPLKGTTYDVVSGPVSSTPEFSVTVYNRWPVHGVVKGTKVYINSPDSIRLPITFDFSTSQWSTFEAMGEPPENASADFRVTNNAVILDDGRMYVAVQYGGVNNARVMRYDFDVDEYNISGWRHLGVNRPPEAEYCAMAGYGTTLLFFGHDGTTISYDVEQGTWDPTLAPSSLHGLAQRNNAWPVAVGDKIYLVGGSYGVEVVNTIDVYDVTTDTWENLGSYPYTAGMYNQSFHHDGRIYIFPRHFASFANPNYTIFDIASGTFESTSFYRLNTEMYSEARGLRASCGTSWLYEGTVYSFVAGGNSSVGTKKCKLEREAWQSENLPAKFDPEWGNVSSQTLRWHSVSGFGETMPQNRYFQFKVDLFVEDSSEYKAFLDTTRVVMPQKILRVPSSGTGTFYTKLGVSDDRFYTGIYSGAFAEDSSFSGYYSTLFSTYFSNTYIPETSNKVIDFPVYNYPTNLWRISYTSPWAIKDGTTTKVWTSTVRSDTLNITPLTVSSGVISYMSSVDLQTWTAPVEVISYGAHGAYDTLSSTDPCVVKMSSSDYRAWYAGEDVSNVQRVLYTTSTDGISWAPPILSHDVNTLSLVGQPDSKGSFAPAVLFRGGVFIMWYNGKAADSTIRIIRGTSTDGVSWGSHSVVLSPGQAGVLDMNGCRWPVVVEELGQFKMWYVGVDESNRQRVMYTLSEDGSVWSVPLQALSPGLHGDDFASVGRVSIISTVPEVGTSAEFSDLSVKIHN